MSVRTVEYHLEMYGSDGEPLFTIEAANAFGAMSVGDDVHLDHIDGFAASLMKGKVGKIEHLFIGSTKDKLIHKIMVYLR